MRTPSAAPEARDLGAAGSSAGDRLSISELHLPAHLIETLAAENVFTVGDWLALGSKRKAIFGITTATAAKVAIAINLARRFGLLEVSSKGKG